MRNPQKGYSIYYDSSTSREKTGRVFKREAWPPEAGGAVRIIVNERTIFFKEINFWKGCEVLVQLL